MLIVPVPMFCVVEIVPLVGLLRVTVKFSLVSPMASPLISTSKVLDVSPGAKVIVCPRRAT